MTIIGTRPELIKLCRVIAELQTHLDHVLVHTGQNYDYELNEIFFQQLNIRKPDHFLSVAASTPAKTIANVIAASDTVMDKENPDALLLLGDTNSCMAVIPAKRRKIPIFHMEAGNRCFDQRVPEEINRKIVDHTSDINMPYTEHARKYLIAEGIRPETVIKTGSPMREVLNFYKPGIEASDVLKRLELQKGKYFIVSVHREENVDSQTNFNDLLNSFNAIAGSYDMPVIVSTHPKTRKRLESLDGSFRLHEQIRFLKPLGFLDYVHLQTKAFCVLSDSGTITEEASILNFAAVTTRNVHERPEGMDEASVIMCGLKSERVLQAIKVATEQFNEEKRVFDIVRDYQADNVSKKVTRIILSYVDYVNRNTWHKHE